MRSPSVCERDRRCAAASRRIGHGQRRGGKWRLPRGARRVPSVNSRSRRAARALHLLLAPKSQVVGRGAISILCSTLDVDITTVAPLRAPTRARDESGSNLKSLLSNRRARRLAPPLGLVPLTELRLTHPAARFRIRTILVCEFAPPPTALPFRAKSLSRLASNK